MRNKFTNQALQAALSQPTPTTAKEVVGRLEEIQLALGGFNNPEPLASFNFLYYRITEEIANGVANSAVPVGAAPVTTVSPLTATSEHPLAGHFERSVELARTAEFEPMPEELADHIEAWLDSDASSRSHFRPLFPSDEAFRARVMEEVERIRSGTRESYLQAVANRVVAGLQFEDPDFMDALDVEFANLYFEALKAWDDDRPLAESWAVLFEHWDDAKEGPVTGAMLGVNAHINHDLAIAVARAHGANGALITDGSPRHLDYLAINGIFEIQIPLLLDILSNRLTDLRRWFYEAAAVTGVIDSIIEWLVIEARDMAWAHAKLIEAGYVLLPVGQSPPIDPVNDTIAGLLANWIEDSPF
jgi:hypothetical protein